MISQTEITCVILDDEPLAAQLIGEYVSKTPDLKLLKSFLRPIEALRFLQQNKVDLLFLDVQMPDLTGIQIMEILKGKIPVVLTTAYPEFAIAGFEYNAIDYLLKPVSFERFLVAIQKFRVQQRRTEEPIDQIRTVEDSEGHLFVKSEYKIQRIPYSEILYLQGLRDYVAIHTTDKKILTLQSMKSFEELLPSSGFIRIHRSYIISIHKIEFVERNRVYIRSNPLPISESYRDVFFKAIKR